MPKLKHNRLLEQLKYDPLTGVFTWLVTRNRITQGDVAGSVSKEGYRVIRIDGEHHKAHRLAWFYVHGSWPSGIIDHKDGNKDNNKIKNLRDTSQAEHYEIPILNFGSMSDDQISDNIFAINERTRHES